MEKTKTNWTKNPSKKQLFLISTGWILGIILLILSMTDFFKENVFQGKYLLLYFLIIASTLNTFKLVRNYLKNSNV